MTCPTISLISSAYKKTRENIYYPDLAISNNKTKIRRYLKGRLSNREASRRRKDDFDVLA